MHTALVAERVRLHGAIAATSAAASALLGVVLVVAIWRYSDAARLLGWLAALALALSCRLGLAWSHRRAAAVAPPHARPAIWLWRYRAVFAVNGLVWGAAGVLLLPDATAVVFNVLAFALFAVAAGALLATAFDVAAAAIFIAPALAPLVRYLFIDPEQSSPGVGAMVVMFTALAFLIATRAQRLLRETMLLRLAERQRVDEVGNAQRALAEQHHLLKLLLQTTQQGFWFVDTQGLTVDVNPAMCALLGRPREQIVGHSAREFFAGADLHILQRELEIRRQGQASRYEIGITRPDASRVHCVNNASPVSDTQGKRLGSIGLWTDITQRRQAETALHTYEVVANSITDMVSVVGEDQIYRMVNDAWCRYLGVARADAVGHYIRNVLPAASTSRVALMRSSSGRIIRRNPAAA